MAMVTIVMLASSCIYILDASNGRCNYAIVHRPLLASSVYIHLMQAVDDGKYGIVTIVHACIKCIYKTSSEVKYGIVTIAMLASSCIYTLDARWKM